jgi:ABC-type transport system involved in multi-copper enzyme maturation permease subunit
MFIFEMKFNININDNIDYAASQDIYNIMIVLETLMVLIMVPFFTAASIASEREKQTLDLILSTGINSYTIVLGKLLESLSLLILYVLSSLPVISIIFTIGGISILNIIQFIFEIIVSSIFIGSMGILSSCIFKKVISATICSYVTIVVVSIFTVGIVLITYMYIRFFGLNIQDLNLNWIAFVIMLNPVIDIIHAVSGDSFFIGSLNTQIINMIDSADIMKYWELISISMRIIISIIILCISAHLLSPVKNKDRLRRSRK